MPNIVAGDVKQSSGGAPIGAFVIRQGRGSVLQANGRVERGVRKAMCSDAPPALKGGICLHSAEAEDDVTGFRTMGLLVNPEDSIYWVYILIKFLYNIYRTEARLLWVGNVSHKLQD